ncbi:hypothetical protein [Pedobacter steynii]|uniref:Uncharacterized protein n=1 Tax=Pedobacter steynii TaxID=430522 RepID=A0A1D7QKZ4_9SPHI|nr:hypothetical protein [Pedobacter steynii]AOM79327.1 hypothetical protein BFS30_20440 [Pedobacter steynii]
MKDLLTQDISQHISLSPEETEEVCSLFQPKVIKKRAFYQMKVKSAGLKALLGISPKVATGSAFKLTLNSALN